MRCRVAEGNHGQIDGFERFWVDGVLVTLTQTGNWANRYVQVSTHAGWGAGGNYAPLRDNFPTWTEAHRLEKQATYLVRANAPSPEEFQKYFPKGDHTLYQWEIKGWRITPSDELASLTLPPAAVRSMGTTASA